MKITEKAFTAQVRRAAALYGWELQAHTWNSIHSPKGWPDLVFARPDSEKHPVVLVRELKVGRGTLTPEQDAWLSALDGRGISSGLWTPEDWYEIEFTLNLKGS